MNEELRNSVRRTLENIRYITDDNNLSFSECDSIYSRYTDKELAQCLDVEFSNFMVMILKKVLKEDIK